jgi:hypothetical protein
MVVRIIAASIFALGFAGAAFALDASAPVVAAEGDTLLIERVQEENTAAMPARGMSAQEVESRFGAPSSKLDPRGGQKRQWPTINRWTYPTFTVYFEKSRVIDAVANKADANEVGPKPAIR